MKIRHLLAPIATVLALGGLAAAPAPAHAATKSVTVRVNGLQIYGGTATFTGYTGVSGVTVSGVTCTGLTNGSAISPTLAALGSYTIDGLTCSGGVLSHPDYAITKYIGMRHTVNKAPLRVVADNKTREFRDPNPPLTYTVTGFQNGEDASLLTGAPTMSTTAKPDSQVGNYYNISIAAGTLSAGNNYVLRPFIAGKMTVTHKSVIVAVTGAQVYGDAAPKFTGNSGWEGIYVGGVTCTKLADGRDIVPTLPVANLLQIDTSTCSGGTLTGRNYKIVGYSSVKFNVLKAPLTLTAEPKSKTYGDANPALTYTVSGYVNGDDAASALTGDPSLTTVADETSDVGSYPIDLEVGSLAARNYHFTFKDSTLAVTKAVLSVSANAATREYGAADPTFSAAYAGFKNGDTVADLTGAPAFSTPATASSNPGNYPLFVTAGTLASSNYAFGPFNGNILTITQADANIETKRMTAGGVLEATLTAGAAKAPVQGATITFFTGNGSAIACTATTDATGKATCTVTNNGHRTQIATGGYVARFAGTAGVKAGEKRQGIL
ncbi:MBG domain-containing protein [Nocardioides stalactiti]|uniref:MBG domain-containing protein n=1 Tax=Nocardioides stalactiti TaxID=2755356 RepID=UPI00160210BE|nr:MBG domain-containing protein [Nocardioides stalactiti]